MTLRSPLPHNVRQGLASISSSLFIQNKTRDCGDGHSYHTGHEVLSNLPLQMMLYFNLFYFPFWFLSEIIILELKFHLLSSYYKFLLVTALVVLMVVEILRLYLGYIGNLHEKVPELAGCLLLTFLIQMPLLLFLLTDEQTLILPLEYAVHSIYMIFLNAELVVCFFALKVMTRQLATQFYLQHSEDLANKEIYTQRSQAEMQYSHGNVREVLERDALLY
ncbi:transmembrane protein 17B-like [Bombina bombina]|uniref:transmembrane protein 17B-like n=1 Tax=Bombina bombina TaxID=8345 RepID=UPI00235A9434|nr:transmembrane protein 17B-like [Bombina bombina]